MADSREQFVRDKLENGNLNDYDRAIFIAELEQIEASKQQLAESNEAIAEDIRTNGRPYIIAVSGAEINLQDYIETDANYRLIAIALSQRDNETDAAHREVVRELNNRAEAERQQHREQIAAADIANDEKTDELCDQLQRLRAEIATLTVERDTNKEERHQFKLERDDFERRLQAATSEIDSLKAQLAAQVTPQTPMPTNINSDLTEAIKAAQAAKPAIYDVVKDQLEINYTAKLLATDEVIEGKVIYIGKYREATDEEISRFRAELEAAKEAEQAELESIPENVEPVEVEPIPAPQFQDEVQDDNTADGLGGDTVKTESVPHNDGGAVTRQEFEMLKGRVDYLFLREGIIESLREAS